MIRFLLNSYDIDQQSVMFPKMTKYLQGDSSNIYQYTRVVCVCVRVYVYLQGEGVSIYFLLERISVFFTCY